MLAHMRTSAAVDLALLQIVEQVQFADHPSAPNLTPRGRFVPDLSSHCLRISSSQH
jgi:hypothetical protein